MLIWSRKVTVKDNPTKDEKRGLKMHLAGGESGAPL